MLKIVNTQNHAMQRQAVPTPAEPTLPSEMVAEAHLAPTPADLPRICRIAASALGGSRSFICLNGAGGKPYLLSHHGARPSAETVEGLARLAGEEPAPADDVVGWTLAALPGPSDRPFGFLAVERHVPGPRVAADQILVDLASIAGNQLALARRASHDGLTGALSRASFLGLLSDRLAGARRPLGLLLIDVDHFKAVNDRHGHAAGDRVLAAIGHALRVRMRPGDRIGRIGGEEFGVLMLDAGPAESLATAERLRTEIEQRTMPLTEGRIGVTISIGVASTEARGRDASTLMGEADRALYAAKNAGRNRAILAPSLVAVT